MFKFVCRLDLGGGGGEGVWKRNCAAFIGDSEGIVKPTEWHRAGLDTAWYRGPSRTDFVICVLLDDRRRRRCSLVVESNKTV
jgi:hypothetical protein